MLILAMDTSTNQVGIALGTETGLLGELRLVGGRRHAEQLTPGIEGLLEEAGVVAAELAAVAVGIGPGLYTGLRVGVTTAKVMAQSLGVPVVPIASLDLVAYPLRFTDRTIFAALDARRSELFYAQYRPVPGGVQRETEYTVGDVEDLVADLVAVGGDVLLAGDGALLYRDRLDDVDPVEFASPSFAHPSPAALVELACARYRREEFVRPAEVEPVYLRRSDAEIAWDSRTGAR